MLIGGLAGDAAESLMWQMSLINEERLRGKAHQLSRVLLDTNDRLLGEEIIQHALARGKRPRQSPTARSSRSDDSARRMEIDRNSWIGRWH